MPAPLWGVPVLVVQLSEPHSEPSQAQKGTCSAAEKAQESFLQHLLTPLTELCQGILLLA